MTRNIVPGPDPGPGTRGFLGFLIVLLAVALTLTSCAATADSPLAPSAERVSISEKRATVMAAAATPTATPVSTATATPVSTATPPPLPCDGAPNCARCEWRLGEDDTLVPVLVYLDGRVEYMTSINHFWNIPNVCP